MNVTEDDLGHEIISEVTNRGELLLSQREYKIAPPADDEVIVKMEAAPINPSDMALLLGPVQMTSLQPREHGLSGTIPGNRLSELQARIDKPMTVGNEGAGTVVAAGSAATQLIGKSVAILGGGMYTEYRTVKAETCLVLPDTASAVEGASAYINPLTTLCMIETMRREGHKAIVHTAAASNLGQMLNRLCASEGIDIVNIVRKPVHREILENLGAKYIIDSTSEHFAAELTDAMISTGATLAFDAVGGGTLASQILSSMESALNKTATSYTPYGSKTLKQVYMYGSMDWAPTVLNRNYGMSWNIGGWLLTWKLQEFGMEVQRAMKQRVAKELSTTFASTYSIEIGLSDLLIPDTIREIARFGTGAKYLVNPAKGKAE